MAKNKETRKGASPLSATMRSQEAVDAILEAWSRIPDIDEVLRKAGIQRHRLSTLLYDDEIGQACETRLDAMLATPFRVEPNDGANSARLIEIMEPILIDAITGAWNARLFGYSVMEAVYEVKEDGVIGFSFVGEKPMQWFEPKSDGRLMFFPLSGSVNGSGELCDQEYKFFLTRARASYAQPFGEALLSRLYWAWYFRNSGWKYWAKFLERFGSPLLVGKSNDSVEMVNMLLCAHSQSVMGIDREDSVEAIGVDASNSGEAFTNFESAVIRRIQKMVLGQTLTSGTDDTSGSRALGIVHQSVRMDKRNSDILLVRPTLQKLVDAICKLNKWEPHKVVFADEVGLEADRAARDAVLYSIGVRFTEEYIQDSYELRERDFRILKDVEKDPEAKKEEVPLEDKEEDELKNDSPANDISKEGMPEGKGKAQLE